MTTKTTRVYNKDSSPEEQRPRCFRITVTRGPDKGASYEVGAKSPAPPSEDGNKLRVKDRTVVTIGKHASNDLQLKDVTVSGHHLSVKATPDGYLVLHDHNSTNGTRLGYVRIKEATLNYKEGGALNSAEIGVGKNTLRIDILNEFIEQPRSSHDCFGDLLGVSPEMREIFSYLPKLAKHDAGVLILGERGTGKSMLARALHDQSHRSGRPFITVDCGALSSSLIESELYGHVANAFNGATDRAGAFESARGGTIFIDEIGELSPELQKKFLGVLQDRTVKRVGSNEPKGIDVRVIAATNRDISVAMNSGAFRDDLYDRLAKFVVRIPPLRDRRGDIEHLATRFYEELSMGKAIPVELLHKYCSLPWHGNVRELANEVERAVFFSEFASLTRAPALGSAPPTVAPSAPPAAPSPFNLNIPFKIAKQQASLEWEKGYLTELMKYARGNISAAARKVETDRHHIRERLAAVGLLPASSTDEE